LKHPALVTVHWPGWTGHAPSFWQRALVIVQDPCATHSGVVKQAELSMLHCPGSVGHCESTAHDNALALQVPVTAGHWLSTKQPAPVALHCPATVGQ
jgi:hypothetical protein